MDQDRMKRLDSLFEAFSIIAEGRYVYLCDMREDYSRWSQSAVDYFDLPSNYMENAGAIWEQHIHPDDRDTYTQSIAAIFAGTDSGHDMQYRALAKNGSYVVCTCRGVVIRDENDVPAFFGGVIQNHGALSYIDTATGLRSLYGFFDDLQSLFWKQDTGTVLLLGMSQFSNINDLYGYTFGNSVLRTVANLLMREFSNTGAVYRMDGTKFAVISHALDAEAICNAFRKIRTQLAHQFEVEGHCLSLSVNAGVLTVDNFDISTETVYSCLKYAYYESKNSQLGDPVIFADALSDDNRLYVEKLNVIRTSVTDNCRGFFLCYQPIIDARTDRLKGMEALIRWKSDKYGMVPPIQFIPVLEQDTLFPELGKWILRTSLTEGKRLLVHYPDLIMNVNLSYTQLEKSSFVSDVLSLLDETGFPPENLCLEITERCRMLDMALLKNMFRIFREKGIRVALDDFGTGYSSLGLLREVTVDTIKVDREYVKNVETSPFDQNTLGAISGLAEAFGTELCVEGVETAGMRDFLRQYPSVSSFQGYYYSKPVPIDELLRKYVEE